MDIDSLVDIAAAVHRGFHNQGMSLLQERRNELISRNDCETRMADLLPLYVEELQAEGASEYEAHLAAEAAQMAWLADMMALAANNLDLKLGDYQFMEGDPKREQLERGVEIGAELVEQLIEGANFQLTVHDLASKFTRTELEVSLYLKRLVLALRQTPTTT